MRHLKTIGVAVVAIPALVTAPLALALPDISTLTSSLKLHFADNSKTTTLFETSVGTVLSGKGIEILLELASLGSLGPFTARLLHVIDSTGQKECSSYGEVEGEVLVTGEWHMVPITTKPLLNGFAFLVGSLVLITCGAEKIDVKGCALATTNATETKYLTSVSATLGSNGKGQALQRQYLNDVPENVKCILESELVGTKLVREAAEVVNGGKEVELVDVSKPQEMFSITGL